MKRREFLVRSATVAGGMVPLLARAAAPCPPPTLSVEGGSSVTTSCGDKEADWLERSTGKGVVWCHDFRSDAEVDLFRWASGIGNDLNDVARPNTVRRITSDGVTGGGCMEIFRPAGSSEGSVWWRPFSPLTNSGRGSPDPAAGGSLPVLSWTPTQGGSATSGWQRGWYGNAAYHNQAIFDGTEFYLQVRVKMDPNRVRTGPRGGKLMYLTRTDRSLTSQEIVTVSGQVRGDQNYFSMYRSGSPPLESDPPGVNEHGNQPNSELGYCRFDNSGGNLKNCWAWSGGWDTVLYHIVPGRSSNNDTRIEVWAAHEGETQYTKIWDQPNANVPFDGVQGYNALICSAYQNAAETSVSIYHRFDQIIFSREFIACPQA